MKPKEDPEIARQQKIAEREKIDAIRERTEDDTDRLTRIFGGSAVRRIALGGGLAKTTGL